MTQAEAEAKQSPVAPPKGVVRAKAPNGELEIFVKPPREGGPWFRVKHPFYGHKLVKAATPDEAVMAYIAEYSPASAGNKDSVKEFYKLGRIAKLAEPVPA